jgi:hypothetical protein
MLKGTIAMGHDQSPRATANPLALPDIVRLLAILETSQEARS